MADLYLAIIVLVAAAAASFWFAVRVTARGPKYRCDLLAIQLVLTMTLYTVHLWHQVTMARLLPFANLVVLGNWFLPAAGFMAGLTWRRIADHPVRRRFAVALLLSAAFYSSIHPLLGKPPDCDNQWDGDVCLQTSPHTCSPASAATLLRAHGIPATEREMVDLCLTREGTTWAGIYRGLKQKTKGTPYDVEFFQGSVEELAVAVGQEGRPLLLSVGIPRNHSLPAEYELEWGLTPGLAHSIVLFRVVNSTIFVVGDPREGSERWTSRDMSLLWHGEAIRLVPRYSPMAGRLASNQPANSKGWGGQPVTASTIPAF